MPEAYEVLTIVKKDVDEGGHYKDITPDHPAFHVHERTLSDFAHFHLDKETIERVRQKTLIAEFKLFTKPGDNLLSAVASFKYTCEDENIEHDPCVVKIRVQGPDWFELMTDNAFSKEIGFYESLLSHLNEKLTEINLRELSFPKLIYSVERQFEKTIFFENLLSRGFRMADRKVGLDSNKSSLALKELGKMHAASNLLFKDMTNAEILHRFPMLYEIWHKVYEDEETMDTHFTSGVKLALNLITNEKDMRILDETEKTKRKVIASNLRKMSSNVQQQLFQQLESCEPFRVVCHGDCWTNNFLFKESAEGIATSCYMLDTQMIRIGSPALDLNHFFWVSVSHSVRKDHFRELLEIYYDSFNSVLSAAGTPMPFTFDELLQEFKHKHLYGFYIAMMILSVVLIPTDKIPKKENYTNDMQGYTDRFEKVCKEVFETDPKAKEIYLAVIDELYEAGFLSKRDNYELEAQAKRLRSS